jgi:hypothetical protein
MLLAQQTVRSASRRHSPGSDAVFWRRKPGLCLRLLGPWPNDWEIKVGIMRRKIFRGDKLSPQRDDGVRGRQLILLALRPNTYHIPLFGDFKEKIGRYLLYSDLWHNHLFLRFIYCKCIYSRQYLQQGLYKHLIKIYFLSQPVN